MVVKPKRHPIQFLSKSARLLFSSTNSTSSLVQKSYDQVSDGYDEAWTSHMRSQTEELISKLNIKPGNEALDLTCGTGYATGLLAARTNTTVVGVDQSVRMLEQARKNYGSSCKFVQADILEYLRAAPDKSFDVVTCCWGLGYSKPLAVLREIRRVLRPGGQVGIIDNSIFSLREVFYCSCLAFMEYPDALDNAMKFRFLTGTQQFRLWLRLNCLKPITSWSGHKSYTVPDGRSAIARLHATGAAAGFEHAAKPEYQERVFNRFAQILEEKYSRDGVITITHRYFAGIARK